ncbi:MAG TPA: hypothetical protein VGK10_04610 [Prolixibacteraceae bacterium]|jgi:hypothetical protein
MSNQFNSSNRLTQKSGNQFVKGMKKIFFYLVILIVLFLAVFIYWSYYYTYSDGSRAGLLQKVSRKGNIFKTYEGEMILSSVQSNINVPLASEKFFFSVSNKRVAEKLSALQGEFIVVHYEEKKGTLPWRGESTYVVDSVSVSHRP